MQELKFNTASKPQSGPEEALQVACAKYLELNNIVFFHCPNGGNRDVVTGAKLKAQGVKRGVPDLIMPGLSLVVELKTNANKPSFEQICWLNYFRSIGWGAYWLNSLDEFIECIKYVKIQNAITKP